MKHLIAIFVLTITFPFFGCGGGSDSTQELPSYNDYISTLPDDTEIVSNLAVVAHHKNSIPLLVILLEYDNQSIVSDDATWAEKIFGTNDKQLNGYYQETSKGYFRFTPANESYNTANDGVIKTKLAKNHLDLSINGTDFYTLLAADLNASIAQTDPYIDYSVFDTDANGYITPQELTVIFVIAGCEDAYEGRHVHNGIWAHQGSLPSTYAPTLDGMTLFLGSREGRYAVFGELHDNSDPHDATIGIIAHELGHATFGLPDLYNTQGSYGGIGFFGLMGSGAWTRKIPSEFPGETPIHLCAWSKSFLAWVTPIELENTSTTLTESASKDFNVIKIPISANHYYLLENRNDSGFDRGLQSLGSDFVGGIAIWHIDQTKLTIDYFLSNTVNADTDNKGVDLVEATDPVLDLLPNETGTPKALFFDPNRTTFGEKVTDISAPGATMNLTIH